MVKFVENGLRTTDAIIGGDTDTAVKVGTEMLKTVAVGVLAIGIVDACDGIGESLDGTVDGLPVADNDVYDGIVDELDGMVDGLIDTVNNFLMVDNVDFIENPNEHYVTPYERLLPDGRTIWVDGDGDTTVDTNGGWLQSNPDYKA